MMRNPAVSPLELLLATLHHINAPSRPADDATVYAHRCEQVEYEHCTIWVGACFFIARNAGPLA